MSSSFAVTGDESFPDVELVFARVSSSEADGSALRQDLLETWVAVTDAGGAVGFTAPADADEVKRALDAALKRVAVGRDALGVLRDGDRMARDLGLEQLQLTVRGGTGLERFYGRFGYAVVGRHPGALRVAPGDDCDEIMMVASL
jgi:hypothetical protein